MKYIIRSSNAGSPISRDEIERKRKALVKDLVDAGKQYVTYNAQLGSKDDDGNRIEENVLVIEEVGDARLV